jgi:hypothetical protein
VRGTPVHLVSSRRGERGRNDGTEVLRVDQGRGEREADQKQQQSVRNREASRVDSRRGRRIMKKENRDKARLENADVYGNDKRWRLVAGWMDGQARWV